MKNKASLTALLLGITVAAGFSAKAHASYYDNSVEATEVAEAMAHCADEAKQLFPTGAEYLDEVTAQYSKVSNSIDKKTYTFQSYIAGYVFGPPRQLVASLNVTVTLNHADPLRADARSTVKWTCSLSK